jgi:shikimate kinase
VISLGGGALETAEVRTLLHSARDSQVVFLEAPLPMLIDRCVAQEAESGGGPARPVLQDRERLEHRYELRLAYYRNAHLTVATQSLTPEEVAATIQAALDDGNSPNP